eukprot:12782772-Alexandrium_andersonii.AAC.1
MADPPCPDKRAGSDESGPSGTPKGMSMKPPIHLGQTVRPELSGVDRLLPLGGREGSNDRGIGEH